MADPVITKQTARVEHIKIESTKLFAEVKAALEELVAPLDPAIPEALRQGDIGLAKEALQRGSELAIFSARDHGGLLRVAGLARKAVQYEIGNPLTASSMTQHRCRPHSTRHCASCSTKTTPVVRSLNTTDPPHYSVSSVTNASPQ